MIQPAKSAGDEDARERMDYRRKRTPAVRGKGMPHGLKVYVWACVIAVLLFLVARALGAISLP